MKKLSHNIKNTAWVFGSQIFSHIAKLFLFLVVARKLGVTEFGNLSFALSFYVIFSFLADLGIPAVLRRNYSVLKEKTTHFSYAISLKIWLTAISTIIVFIASFIVTKDVSLQKLIWLIWLFGVSNLFSEVFFSYFEAENNLKIRGVVRCSRSIFILILGSIIAVLKGTAVSVALAFLIEGLLALFFVIYIFIKKNKNLILKKSNDVYQSIIKESWYSALMSLFWNIYCSFDVFMLGIFNQIQAAGYYGAVQRLFNAVMSPAIILPHIYIPILTKKIKEKKSIKSTMKTLTITSVSGAILLFIVGIFFPEIVVNIVYGAEYLEATFALTILCITAGIFYINNIFFSLAFALYEDKKILINNVFMSVLNISLNIYVIPRYSFNGAAITTLISTIFMLIGNIYICHIALKKIK